MPAFGRSSATFRPCYRSESVIRMADFSNHYAYLEKVAVRVAKAEVLLKEISARSNRKGTERASLIQQYFDTEELNEVIFELGLSPDEVEGDTMTTRPFHLVQMCERRGLGAELRRVLGEKRPFVDW